MLSIRSASVPKYLRSGVFFENLDLLDESEFNVPENCYKEDCYIETIQDLILLLNTVRFWGLHEPPIEVFQFIVGNGGVGNSLDLRNDFPELEQYIENVFAVKNANLSERIPMALQHKMGQSVVVWLHHHGSLLTGEATECAASSGDIESLMYLHAHSCPWDERTTSAAATNHNIDCLLFAMHRGCPIDNKLMNVIAKMGYIDVLKVLHNEGIAWNESTLTAAIRGQQLDCVRFLREQGCSIANGVCTEAVNTHPTPATLEILKYLHEQGAEWDVYTFKYAALHGNLPCLVYLQTNGCPCDEYATSLAAGGGYLSCLVYLHAEGCPWDERTVSFAVSGGHWRCALYTIAHGCAWYKTARVVCGFFVCALTCFTVLRWPNDYIWYNAAKVSLAIIDCIQEVYDTYRLAYKLRRVFLGDDYVVTWLDTAYNYMRYVKTPISWYFVYLNFHYLYTVWSN